MKRGTVLVAVGEGVVGGLFSDGIAALIRSEGRKLPQAAQLFARQLGKLAAYN